MALISLIRRKDGSSQFLLLLLGGVHLVASLQLSMFQRFHQLRLHTRLQNRLFSLGISNQIRNDIFIGDIDGVRRRINFLDIGNDSSNPPIVYLGGTAQTIQSFSLHTRAFSNSRRLIIPELRGQGRTDLLPQYCFIDRHCKDFVALMEILNVTEVHLVGFSFGGRVACAIAGMHPNLVSRLSITGVPLRRPALGKFIINSWCEGLSSRQIRNVAWSFVINGYSQAFIEKYESRLESFVDMVVESNDVDKLFHLIDKSKSAVNDTYAVDMCASKIVCPCQVIGATEDRIAGYTAVADLAATIENASFETINSGHLAPFEDPINWRKKVLSFLEA